MRLSDYKQSAHSWSPGGISFIEICLRQIFTNGSWLVALLRAGHRPAPTTTGYSSAYNQNCRGRSVIDPPLLSLP